MPPALRRIAAAALSLSLLALPSLAQQAGDAAAGATKAATCTACHGLNGNSANPEWPSIAGQNAAYVREQVAAIKSGKRPNVLMQPIVQSLTDQDIADLAAFFSQQTPTGLEADPSYWKAGQKLYRGGDGARGIPACMTCHGPVGRGNPAAGYPALQAQHSVYTVKQLENYAANARYAKDANGKSQSSPNAQMMNLIASRLSAEDRRNLASYIQGMR
ncbi:MAG TPA: c-type cytochrome [Steroidobacteraceae bacterium]|nr:c-type cytochrome [Steroidobacteraceae bacterium]